MAKITFAEISEIVGINRNKLEVSSKLIEKHKINKFIDDIKPNKDLFLLISPLSPQSKSTQHEKRIIYVFGGKKIKSTADKGDYVDSDGNFFEVKCSTPSKNGNCLNVVQIRLHQQIEYYICCFIDDISYVNNYVFKLTKQQMEGEVKLMGASAHGTSKKEQTNREWRLTIKLDEPNNVNTKRWLTNYRNSEIERKIFFGNKNPPKK